MRSIARVGALCLAASLALLAASAPAAAAPKRISGKLSKPGYTVIALAANGKATSVRAARGRFRLRPPTRRVTLHLRAPNGRYAGPVVSGREKKGKRAILGVKAEAKLGKVRVRRRYATVSREAAKRWIDLRRWARSKRGVPIGVGNFGRVRSRPSRAAPRDDRDLDGIPDPLDIDDDGDLILDNLDRSTAARASQAEERFDFQSSIGGGLHQTVNANAAGLTVQQMDAALAGFGALGMTILPGDSAELDCGGSPNPSPPPPRLGGLVYCSTGGTGRLFKPGFSYSDSPSFPDCCDPDGDGFGTLTPSPNPVPAMVLSHGATTAQIRTGDVLIERVMRSGVESQFPAAVGNIFATVPALVSYSDGQGNSATVSYPVSGPNPGPAGPGTLENPFPVRAGPSGDVVLTLTFWRPQRRPIPPETGEWIDIGRLNYTAAGAAGGPCPQSAFSDTDPNLAPAWSPVGFGGGPAGGFTDLADDQPASPANTFTYTLNLSQCLAARGLSWNPGEVRGFAFAGVVGSGQPDNALQSTHFKRQ